MIRRDHLAAKIIAFVLLNLLITVVFLVLPAKEDNSSFLSGFHLGLLLIGFPLTAVVYGAALPFVTFRDTWFLLVEQFVFLGVILICALKYAGADAIPAALILWAGMLVVCAIVYAVKIGVKMLLDKRKGKEKHEGE